MDSLGKARNCSVCGHEADEKDRFCESCGSRLRPMPEAAAQKPKPLAVSDLFNNAPDWEVEPPDDD